MRQLNLETLKLAKRAENNKINLVESFVDLGPVIPILSNPESQIMFGRRGTGKTHILSYLHDQIRIKDECAVFLDMRLIGSTGGIYSDASLGVHERATRLLVDTLGAIHQSMLEQVANSTSSMNISVLAPYLDAFAEASAEVVVEGLVETEFKDESKNSDSSEMGAELGFKQTPALKVAAKQSQAVSAVNSHRTAISGKARLRVHFGAVSKAARDLVSRLPGQRLWLVLDEWSEIPLDLQPYLADLLRRTLFPIPGVAVKIAAIGQRCNFRITDENSGYIGFEIGADAAASLNLDEYLVFDNEAHRAKNFFSEMLYRHLKSIAEDGFEQLYPTSSKLISELFTQVNAFEEFVRAAEGVPRDAINILSLAAQNADEDKISVPSVRHAAKNWYARGKQSSIASRPEATMLLNWIVDEVIQHRQAKAFLVPNDVKDELIEFLYDARVLHIMREGISAQDLPGKRFNVYSIDFGCYVDLINTNKAPKGLFEIEENVYADVPQTDYRSIRRAILDLSAFYDSLNQ